MSDSYREPPDNDHRDTDRLPGMYSGADPTNVVGRRLLAHCLDLAILIGIMLAVFAPRVHVNDRAPNGFCRQFPQGQCAQMGSQAVVFPNNFQTVGTAIVLGFWCAIGAIEGLTGAFFGKRILRLHVVAKDGGRPGLARGLSRGAMMLIDSYFCFLIGLVAVLTTRPRCRLGDRIAGTWVVPVDMLIASGIDPIVWDENRGEYVYRDPVSGAAQVWDAATNRWTPLQ